MKRILVPVIMGEKHTWSVIHGLRLAQRLSASLTILEVDISAQGGEATGCTSFFREEGGRRCDWITQTEKKEVNYELLRVKGEFCNEIRHFCQQRSILTLVLDLSVGWRRPSLVDLLEMAGDLQSAKLCKVELLGKK